MPILAKDIDGLEPEIIDGILVGYVVMKNQGPTQIEKDINSGRYGYKLKNKVDWTDIINHTSNNKKYFSHISEKRYSNKNPKYKYLNMNVEDYIDLTFLAGDQFNKAGSATFSGDDDDIYQEAVRVVNKGIHSFNKEIRALDLIDIRSDNGKLGGLYSSKSIMSDNFEATGDGVFIGVFTGTNNINFQITLQVARETDIVGTTSMTIYGSGVRTSPPTDYEKKFRPFAYDIITKVESIGYGHEPWLIKISFKNETDRKTFWNDTDQN